MEYKTNNYNNFFCVLSAVAVVCKRKEEQPPPPEQPSPKKPRLVFTDLQRRTLQAIFKVKYIGFLKQFE
jgi:hypothetical protein